MASILLKVNGKARTVNVDPSTPLLYVLRNDVGVHGPKFGCGLAQCGACTVIVGGETMRSCVARVSSVQGKEITTLEGLGTLDHPSALQKAFIDEQAAQCGFCMNGIVLTAKVLLDQKPNPTVEEIKDAMDPVLCRCGTHLRIIRAIRRAATQKA